MLNLNPHREKLNMDMYMQKTYRDAKEKTSQKHFASHSQQSIPPTTNITYFSVIASEWLNITIPQVKESTINKYHNLLQSYILPIYGEIPLSHITHDFIECQCNNLLLYGGKNKSGLSSKTVMDTLSVIRNILKFCSTKRNFSFHVMERLCRLSKFPHQ